MERDESEEEAGEVSPPYALDHIRTWVSIVKPGSIIIVDGTVFEIIGIKGQRVRLRVKAHKEKEIHLHK